MSYPLQQEFKTDDAHGTDTPTRSENSTLNKQVTNAERNFHLVNSAQSGSIDCYIESII